MFGAAAQRMTLASGQRRLDKAVAEVPDWRGFIVCSSDAQACSRCRSWPAATPSSVREPSSITFQDVYATRSPRRRRHSPAH